QRPRSASERGHEPPRNLTGVVDEPRASPLLRSNPTGLRLFLRKLQSRFVGSRSFARAAGCAFGTFTRISLTSVPPPFSSIESEKIPKPLLGMTFIWYRPEPSPRAL